MISAIDQTLAKILASSTSLSGTAKIGFHLPGLESAIKPRVDLYCHRLRDRSPFQPANPRKASAPNCDEQSAISGNNSLAWFDVSFLVSAWDYTALGKQSLLSTTLALLLWQRLLQAELPAPELRGYGSLFVKIAAVFPTDTATLLKLPGVPFRQALPVTVTIPFDLNKAPPLNPRGFAESYSLKALRANPPLSMLNCSLDSISRLFKP